MAQFSIKDFYINGSVSFYSIQSLKCKFGGAVFPTELNTSFTYDEKLSVFPDGNMNNVFFRLPYFIRKADTYNDFSNNMELQQNIIISAINKYIL